MITDSVAEAHTPVATIVAFARALQQVGVPADHARVVAAVEAAATIGIADPTDVYWALRLTLCSDPAHLSRFDALFHDWFGSADTPAPGWVVEFIATDGGLPALTDASSDDSVADAPTGIAASDLERLRQADFAELTEADRAEVARLIALITPRSATRRSRRTRPGRGQRIDVSRTVRAMLRNGGDPARLIRRERRTKPRNLVVLLDVSGSMAPYSDALLRFAHAAVQAAPYRTEVFTMGTRLTRVTRQLRTHDTRAALTAAGTAIPDWQGGTRLGESLRAFLDRWGQRGVARQATVVLASDGWERGDAATLGEQSARLARLAHAVIWANPHRAKPGFTAATAGMQAAIPHVAHFVGGHNVDALTTLARVIADA